MLQYGLALALGRPGPHVLLGARAGEKAARAGSRRRHSLPDAFGRSDFVASVTVATGYGVNGAKRHMIAVILCMIDVWKIVYCVLSCCCYGLCYSAQGLPGAPMS